MKTSTILLLGLGGAGAWWLWKNRNMMPAGPALGQPGIDPGMAALYVECTTGNGCSDADYQRLRAYMFDVMNQPGLTQEQIDWVAARIVDLDNAHASRSTTFVPMPERNFFG